MDLRSRTVRNSANQARQPTGNTVERRTTKRRDEKERRRTNASRLVLERVVKFIVEDTKFYPKMLVIETLEDLEFGPVEELLEVAKEDPILGSVNELWDTHWRWLTERGILDAIKNRIQLTVVPLNEALVCGITELSPSQLRSLMYDRPEETDVSSIVAGHCPVILPCDMDIFNPVAFFKPRNERTTEVFTFDDIYDVLYPSSMSFRRLVNANGGPICTSPWTGDKHVMQVASTLLEDLQYTTAGELEKFGSNRVVSMHDMLYKGRILICGCCHSDELELRNWKDLVSVPIRFLNTGDIDL